MEVAIAWFFVGLAGLGILYTIGLIIFYIQLPKDIEYADYECTCTRCKS